MDLKGLAKISNVYYLSKKDNVFSDHYLKIRHAENRLYPDDLVGRLPYLPRAHAHHSEWKLRIASLERLMRMMKEHKYQKILDIGCGNGWLCQHLAKSTDSYVYGIDVNQIELEQAARLFSSKNCHFIYWNIFQEDWPGPIIDLIVLNSTIQYFPSLPSLLDRVMNLLGKQGEVFIVDSPIYDSEDLTSAHDRSRSYFMKLGAPEMIDLYHHHCWDDLKEFKYQVVYNPKTLKSRVKRRFFRSESPFPFIKVSR
jgi:ubiquinone/menaquinone biosynthesis C-methylase UbiE